MSFTKSQSFTSSQIFSKTLDFSASAEFTLFELLTKSDDGIFDASNDLNPDIGSNKDGQVEKSSNVGMIVGIVIGVVVFIACMAGLVVFFVKKQNAIKQNATGSEDIDMDGAVPKRKIFYFTEHWYDDPPIEMNTEEINDAFVIQIDQQNDENFAVE